MKTIRYNLTNNVSDFRNFNRIITNHIWGEAELILRIWGAQEGTEEFSFRDLGRSKHYFQGSREHRHPPGASYMH